MSSDKKQELFGIKLKNAILIGKKANKTSPSASWKLGFHNSSSTDPNFSMKTSVSARKIGANLWEVQPQFNLTKNNCDRDPNGGSSSLNHRQRHRRHRSFDQLDEEPLDTDPQPSEMETSFRRNTKGLSSLHHTSIGKTDQDLQHVSSESCCGSMQVTPYACAVTPTGYPVKTSTHLVKILDRIWNLEEQHLSHVASIKALKRELDISRAQVTTLLEQRKSDHQEIDELKKSTSDQRKKAVEVTRHELSDIRASLIREKKARILLERLCDEFAKGIRDYEQKVRSLQQTHGKEDETVGKNEPDRLVLHVSEAWLDERAQMNDFSEKTSISENLCCEIETFLEAKKKQSRSSCEEVYAIHDPSSHLASRKTDQGPRGVESSLGRGREGVKSNTLMAKLLEARLESQFSKSKNNKKMV